MRKSVERHIMERISQAGTICFALVDSDNFSSNRAAQVARTAEKCGVAAILVGGSTVSDQLHLDDVVKLIKKSVKLPVILFPGNVTGVSPNADAILFTSLLNSDSPYFITGAQALGALSVRKYGLEALPTGYIVVGEGGAIGFVGRTRGVPPAKPELAAMYALAAQYMGMRFVYLEAGSGVTSHISTTMIRKVRHVFDRVLMVGGGIKNASTASALSKAGADILVLGSILEHSGFETNLRDIVSSVEKRRPT